MTTILVTPPDIADADLLFDDSETRTILKFYWPHLAVKFTDLDVTPARRRFAQQLVIIGIDSSFALGFAQILVETLLRPQAGFVGLAKMGRKLASRYVKHWWKHATQKDLENPRVAEAVRRQIAHNFKPVAEETVENLAYVPRPTPFQMVATATEFWGTA